MPRRQVVLLVVVTFLAGIIGGAVSNWALHGQAIAQSDTRKIVTAEEFRLVDNSGRTRVLLSLLRGKPRLIMTDEKGEFRIELGMGPGEQPALWLRDQNGISRAQLALTALGNPNLEFSDKNNLNRISLGLTMEGSPALFLRDEQEKERVALWQEKGELGLALADPEGRPRAHLAMKDGSKPSLAFYDEDRKVIWFAPN